MGGTWSSALRRLTATRLTPTARLACRMHLAAPDWAGAPGRPPLEQGHRRRVVPVVKPPKARRPAAAPPLLCPSLLRARDFTFGSGSFRAVWEVWTDPPCLPVGSSETLKKNSRSSGHRSEQLWGHPCPVAQRERAERPWSPRPRLSPRLGAKAPQVPHASEAATLAPQLSPGPRGRRVGKRPPRTSGTGFPGRPEKHRSFVFMVFK